MFAYSLLDSGHGRKLERFGAYVLDRPEVAARWRPMLPAADWERADARFAEESKSAGEWRQRRPLPAEWSVKWDGLTFALRLTPFKHVGLFPEQAPQWDWLQETISLAASVRTEPIRILNLFAYTGAATLACAAAGAAVTHVETSRSTLSWARHNAELSGLAGSPIRWIPEDALTFLRRLAKRGERYDGIILDPPVHGIGPKGEHWQFAKQIGPALELCRDILSPDPLFLLLNDYAQDRPPAAWQQEFGRLMGGLPGNIASDRLRLVSQSGCPDLETGTWVRWSRR